MAKNKNIHFDSRLSVEELNILSDCIGKRLDTIILERGTLNLASEPILTCHGRCCLRFSSAGKKAPIVNIYLESMLGEVNAPIVDQGKLKIQKIITEQKSLKDRLILPPHEISEKFVFNVAYPIKTDIKSIQFFGNHERANLKDIDPAIELEYLQKWGYTNFPFVECDSIEFVILEHNTGEKTIISLDYGGFRFDILTQKKQPDLFETSYTIVNGYKKNIILQHKII